MPALRHAAPVLLLLAALVVPACNDKAGNEKADSAGDQQQAAAKPADTAPPPIEANAPPPAPEQLSAAHILIMHAESMRRPESVTRTKEEALALVQEIAKKTKSPGADFGALAKQYSDCPSAPRGGNLGNFSSQQMVKPFSDAVLALDVGETSDVVETPFGYHIIRRQDIQIIPTAAVKHILVMYQGSMRAPAGITRTKDEALARIRECQTRLRAGEDFTALVREYSDDPNGPPSGGDLGTFEQGQMTPEFDTAVFACAVGGTTDIVETPFGFHLIQRYK
jgi:parvulin-like peptidyl-prolyl isomerase